MRILVIGSEGFVGKYFCKFLENKGEEVIRFDVKRGSNEDARFAKLPLEGVDKVFFLAWEVGGAKYLYRGDTQLHQLKWNVLLLNNVMTQLEESKTPFIFVSSQLAEENTIYGVTKRLGEMWTKQLGGCFYRLTNVYGVVEDVDEKSHVISDFINQAKNGVIKMLSSGEEKREFVHLQDVSETLYKMSNNWVSIKEVADMIQTITLEKGLKDLIK